MKKQKGRVSPIVAAAVGAAVAAGAIVLSNKDSQKKIKGAFNKAKTKVTGYVDDVNAKFNNKKEMVEDKVAEGKDKTSETVKAVKDSNKKIKKIWQK